MNKLPPAHKRHRNPFYGKDHIHESEKDKNKKLCTACRGTGHRECPNSCTPCFCPGHCDEVCPLCKGEGLI